MSKCKMNMLWYTHTFSLFFIETNPNPRNTDIIDTCIIFRSWHVSSISFFIGSCISIVLLCIFYEYLRVFQRKMDHHIALSLQAKGKGKPQVSSGRNSPDDSEDSGLLTGRKSLRTSLTGSVQTLTRLQDNLLNETSSSLFQNPGASNHSGIESSSLWSNSLSFLLLDVDIHDIQCA